MYAYFKLSITSELGQKFNEVWQQRIECENKAIDLVDELGGGSRRISPHGVAGGGLVAIEFKTQPDMKTWKNFQNLNSFYSPRLSSKEGKAIKEKMELLPIVEPKAFNDLVGFKAHSSSEERGLVFHSSISAFFIAEDGLFYLDFDISSDYEAPKDLTEITVSEYQKAFSSIEKS